MSDRILVRDQHYDGNDFAQDIFVLILFIPLAVIVFVVWALAEAWKLADDWYQERRRRQVQATPVPR